MSKRNTKRKLTAAELRSRTMTPAELIRESWWCGLPRSPAPWSWPERSAMERLAMERAGGQSGGWVCVDDPRLFPRGQTRMLLRRVALDKGKRNAKPKWVRLHVLTNRGRERLAAMREATAWKRTYGHMLTERRDEASLNRVATALLRKHWCDHAAALVELREEFGHLRDSDIYRRAERTLLLAPLTVSEALEIGYEDVVWPARTREANA